MSEDLTKTLHRVRNIYLEVNCGAACMDMMIVDGIRCLSTRLELNEAESLASTLQKLVDELKEAHSAHLRRTERLADFLAEYVKMGRELRKKYLAEGVEGGP